MASANPVLNDHTTVDSSDPGSDRNESEQVSTVLPLEIQEHIISSGPRFPERDRVAFLCLCALVCKDWVGRSRSLLSLKVTIDTSSRSPPLCHRSQSFLDLVKDPNTTLIHSIKRLYLWRSKDLAVVGPYLPSVEELNISLRRVPGVADSLQQSFSMPSVRIMSLVESVFGSMGEFLRFISFFPSIHSLAMSELYPLVGSKDAFFQTSGVPILGLTKFAIDISYEWDVRFLGSILILLPGLRILHLRPSYCSPDVVADWVSQNSLTIRAEIEVSLMLYCSDRARYPPYINNYADFFSRLDSLELEDVHLKHLEEMIPLWISYCSRLKCITFTTLDGPCLGLLNRVDWTALSSSLGAAKQLKNVRFVRWDNYRTIPAYIKTLSVLAHPHFSLSVQMSEDPDSVEQLVM